MEEILNFLQTYSGAFTFIITVVYVIATIFIMWANIRAANASRKQIDESQKQFDTTSRLQCMPFLQLEFAHGDSKLDCQLEISLRKGERCYFLNNKAKIKNVGNGTATNIIYTWENESLPQKSDEYLVEVDVLPINAIMQGDEYFSLLTIYTKADVEYPQRGKLTFEYNDMLGNTYEQQVWITISKGGASSFDNNQPRFLGKLKYVAEKKGKQKESDGGEMLKCEQKETSNDEELMSEE